MSLWSSIDCAVTFHMTAVPISRQVVDDDAVLPIVNVHVYFNQVMNGTLSILLGSLEFTLVCYLSCRYNKKTLSCQNTSSRRFFLFLPKYNTYAFSSSINVRCICSCKENVKRLLPPPWIHPERVWDLAIINKLLRIIGTYFLPNFGEIHDVISER